MPRNLSADLGIHLPFLRRYARALTGTQESGDAYVRACLQSIVADPSIFPEGSSVRVGLYRLFHVLWSTTQIRDTGAPEASEMEKVASHRLASMPPENRQALLLTAMEGFSEEDAGTIMGLSAAAVADLVEDAVAEIDRQTKTRVLIIEDEAIIALDLSDIVRDLGHEVAAVARTRREAVAAAERHRPGLVLADIQLADGSSGIDAVKDILSSFSVPVIFITAFPQRLLTGERPEPAFLLTKPVEPRTVKAAISQALFFRSPQTVSS